MIVRIVTRVLTSSLPVFWLVVSLLALAAAVGGSLSKDRRYPGVDWALLTNKLRLFVHNRTSGELDVKDIVQTVLMKMLAPTARPWDPAKEPILMFAGSYANTEISNIRRSAYLQHARFGLPSDVVERRLGSAETPEEHLVRAGHARASEARLDALKASVAGDVLCRLLISAFEEGLDDPEDATNRALAAGYSIEQVYAARRKIHREVGNVLAREREADEAALKGDEP